MSDCPHCTDGVRDPGWGEEGPCEYCRPDEYEDWIEELRAEEEQADLEQRFVAREVAAMRRRWPIG